MTVQQRLDAIMDEMSRFDTRLDREASGTGQNWPWYRGRFDLVPDSRKGRVLDMLETFVADGNHECVHSAFLTIDALLTE
jgi:hypothetical protein